MCIRSLNVGCRLRNAIQAPQYKARAMFLLVHPLHSCLNFNSNIFFYLLLTIQLIMQFLLFVTFFFIPQPMAQALFTLLNKSHLNHDD